MTRPFDRHTEDALRRGKQRIRASHGSDPNVTGVGIGYRFRAGQWTDEPVVTVLVAKKRTEAMVSKRRMLPKTVDVDGTAWGVDVVQGGPFRLHIAPSPTPSKPTGDARDVQRADVAEKMMDSVLAPDFTSLTEKVRPPRQGASISNLNETIADGKVAGTLGCLVRDTGDGTICLLTCNHVIGRLNEGATGDPVIQPGGLDGGVEEDNRIGFLKRFAALGDGTEVDAAIAQLDDQSGYTTAIMRDLMPEITPTHPAVGMVVAGDPYGINTFLTRMDATTVALGVEMLRGSPGSGGGGASTEIIGPAPGLNIEKVGRTTGYTSATILGIGFDLEVDTEGDLGVITYENLVWTMFFSLAGDSGSVACLGGDGNLETVLLFLELLIECTLLEALSTYYDLPLDSDENTDLSDQLRDKFMAQSKTGQLLIAATYNNSQVVIDRLNADTGEAHNQSLAQARAQSYYDAYHDFAATLITSDSPTAVVSSNELAAVASILYGLGPAVTNILTPSESTALWTLYASVLEPTQGMNRAQIIDYMNQDSIFNLVYSQIAQVGTIQVPGPASIYGR